MGKCSSKHIFNLPQLVKEAILHCSLQESLRLAMSAREWPWKDGQEWINHVRSALRSWLTVILAEEMHGPQTELQKGFSPVSGVLTKDEAGSQARTRVSRSAAARARRSTLFMLTLLGV
jgi:hypothetical protein